MIGRLQPWIAMGKARLALCVWLAALLLAACDPESVALTPIATRSASPLPRPTATSIPTATPIPPTPTATPSPTPRPIDYQPMIAAIQTYVRTAAIGPQFDLSIGFVDVKTGQRADFDGQTRHFALSTFKGPLGAYYFWMVEQGKLTPQQSDLDRLQPMMSRSDNQATSCVFKRVGGLAGFNDWLAAEGLDRQNNFVAQWENWA
jgi:beta-lactamase class A